MDPSWEWDETLYEQSTRYYVAGRFPYPERLGREILTTTGQDGRSRVLDVGCGPGSLTLVLAPFAGEVVGIDADEGMLAEARRQARRTHVDNVAWRRLRAEQLPAGLGNFDLVTFAQSLHWMDRFEVLKRVRGMLRPGGACVHVHATTARGDESVDPLPLPRPPYHEIETLVRSFLGPTQRAGRSARPKWLGGDEPEIYRAAGFSGGQYFDCVRGEVVERSVDDVIAATFSLSSSTPHLFAERRADFEKQLRDLLVTASAEGRFNERVRDVRFTVWRNLQDKR